MMTIMELERRFTEVDEYVSAEIRETADGLCLRVEVCDFLGFSDDWEEMYSTVDEDAVDEILDELREEAISYTGGMYPVFEFEGFEVRVSYTSYDI